MILIEGAVRLPVENLEKARPHMLAMIAASRAEAGCIDYAYAQDLSDPALVRVVERWVSKAALEAHFASAHLTAWRAMWPALGIGARDLRAYEAEPSEV